MNNSTGLSHPVKKKKKRKKETQPDFTNTDVPCLNTGYLFLVDRTSVAKLTQNFGLNLTFGFKSQCDIRKYIEQLSKLLSLKLYLIKLAFPSTMHVKFESKCFCKYRLP